MFSHFISFFIGVVTTYYLFRQIAKTNVQLLLGLLGRKYPPPPPPTTIPPVPKNETPIMHGRTESNKKVEREEIVRQTESATLKRRIIKDNPPMEEIRDQAEKSNRNSDMNYSESESHQVQKTPSKPRETPQSTGRQSKSSTPIIGSKQALEVADKTPTRSTPTSGKEDHHHKFHKFSILSSLSSYEEIKSIATLHGWLEIRSKIGNSLLSKNVWHRRYVVLLGNWLAYFPNEKCRFDDCYGWVKLDGCTTSVRDPELHELVVRNPSHKIFHRHGPDANMPPCKTKHLMFHSRSKRFIIRCTDEASIMKWKQKLEEGCAMTDNTTTPFDSENEDMYAQGGVLLETENTRASEEEPEVIIPIETVPVINPEAGRVLVRSLTRSHSLRLSKQPSKADNELVTGPPSDTEAEEQIGEEVSKDPENRESLLKLLTKAVGLDITTISLPVSLNEPLSFIQRMCEVLVYSDLLDKASECNESSHRLLFVSAFAISIYSNTTRTTKPFNPYLGETFEYKNSSRFNFFAEQVSHHPPVGASCAENSNFKWYQEQGVKTKFGGNSLACEGVGMLQVFLKKWGEHYTWTGIKTVVHNAVLGTMWLDHFGDMEIVNNKTGEKARLEFTKCGWFGKGQYEVKGWILDSQGRTKAALSGKWNKSIEATIISGPPLPFPNPIWVHTNVSDETNKWKLSPFAKELIASNESIRHSILSTDSRLRTDRIALEAGDMSKAGREKTRIEQEQRQIAKTREQRGETWKPKHFVREIDSDTREGYWKYTGPGWEDC